MTKRWSKKTSSIEVRVAPELKEALGRLSAARGQSVSETVRALVARELRGPAGNPAEGETIMARLVRSPLARGGAMLASVGALAVAYTFAAQSPATASVGAEARVTFAELDTNSDDVITLEEFAALIAEERAVEVEELPEVPEACVGTFVERELADEREELTRPAEAEAEERVAYLDTNADGTVTFDELEAYMVANRAREFLEFDDDGNGFVTLEEVAFMLSPRAREAEAGMLAEEGLSAECIAFLLGEEEEDEDPEDPRLLLAEFDSDRDGRVSLLEFLER